MFWPDSSARQILRGPAKSLGIILWDNTVNTYTNFHGGLASSGQEYVNLYGSVGQTDQLTDMDILRTHWQIS